MHLGRNDIPIAGWLLPRAVVPGQNGEEFISKRLGIGIFTSNIQLFGGFSGVMNTCHEG